MTTSHLTESSTDLFFWGDFNGFLSLVELMIDVHLQPTLRNPRYSWDCRQCKAFEQQLINQLTRCLINRLSGCILDKLPLTVLTTEAWFAVMGMSVFNNLGRLALGAVH